MKKIIILNGSPRKQGTTAALTEVVSKAAAGRGAEIKSYYLNGMNIKGCQSCYACRGKEHRCSLQDNMQELYDEIDAASGIVFATPVYMWQMTAQLKQVVDRLYPYIKPDYSSYLAPGKKVLLAVTQARPDTSMFRHYFEHMGKNLLFLGFGAYKIIIVGGTHKPEDFHAQTEVVAEAGRMGEWLVGMERTEQ
ncbi:flavodoxin family protein [Acetonema longum]|uniref:Nadph-dependent fmn reductase, putative n=1 Tax=Acetonema longum DSM 6540 TaxID=1009370 RepID=F7NDJ0_9FIRM|nr:flavodoxin family protein [Acetonema longum]EGO65852.1 nadph-dependent fmn reductase, putative [Acetonema longum DSM 6540]